MKEVFFGPVPHTGNGSSDPGAHPLHVSVTTTRSRAGLISGEDAAQGPGVIWVHQGPKTFEDPLVQVPAPRSRLGSRTIEKGGYQVLQTFGSGGTKGTEDQPSRRLCSYGAFGWSS